MADLDFNLQRWLGIRLDFLGILLTFVVAILTVGTRFSISPSQTGVTLSYIISVQQAFGWMVRQSAEVENNMNSVERIVSSFLHMDDMALTIHPLRFIMLSNLSKSHLI